MAHKQARHWTVPRLPLPMQTLPSRGVQTRRRRQGQEAHERQRRAFSCSAGSEALQGCFSWSVLSLSWSLCCTLRKVHRSSAVGRRGRCLSAVQAQTEEYKRQIQELTVRLSNLSAEKANLESRNSLLVGLLSALTQSM